MKFSPGQAAGFLLSIHWAVAPGVAADDCKPWTWTWEHALDAGATPSPEPVFFERAAVTEDPRKFAAVVPGQLNCRSWAQTYGVVGYWSCAQLAQESGITVEKFFEFNPALAPDCKGIQPNTEYCVRGFIEPVRATDGKCGPNNGDATCIGSDFGQCCNAETWTCGQTEHDCALGVCYEGQCPGHKRYTTDGNCGYDHSFSLCAGKWGDCCSFPDGKCGTGEAFCGVGKCQSGKCVEFQPQTSPSSSSSSSSSSKPGTSAQSATSSSPSRSPSPSSSYSTTRSV